MLFSLLKIYRSMPLVHYNCLKDIQNMVVQLHLNAPTKRHGISKI